jgi:pre-mRNA branch site protein p14
VRNLPFKITAEELYDVFGKYGALRQVRVGATAEARGTAFVVYEDIYDAKAACDHLSGFNVGGRYLVVLYYQVTKHLKGADAKRQQAELDHLRARVAAGDAAAAAAAAAAEEGGEAAGDSIDDEEDKRLLQVRR